MTIKPSGSRCARLPGAALALLALLLARAGAQDPDRFVAKTRAAHELADLAERCRSTGLTGAVLAARDGKVLLACGVGHADLEGRIPNTANTLFELASLTKQFTAAAVLVLQERRRLRLDDPIARHLPDVPPSCGAVTVRHLLRHTSGIPGTNSRGGGDDLRAVVPLFLEGGPRHEPGTHWEYWNQGYALLSGIIERRSGTAYTTFCGKALFGRAGMRTACFTGDEAPPGVTVAVGRSKRGPRGALEHPYGSFGYQYRGMGGAVSSVWDLWRWDRALHGTKVLAEASKEELFEPGLSDYALGWRVRTDGGRVVQSHGGAVRGFLCELRRYPEEDACLAVLCNRDDVQIHRFAGLLERRLFGADVVPPPLPLPQAVQAALTGTWKGPQEQRLTVEADGDVTHARIEWKPGGPTLRRFLGTGGTRAGNLLLYDWSRTLPVRLVRDAAGRAVRITVDGDLTFERS